MDRKLLISLLRNLLNTNVLYGGNNAEGFSLFEEKYCYNPDLQPVFTAAYLRDFASGCQEHIFYELRDEFGIWVQMFRFEDEFFLLGPYVKRLFDEQRTQRTLLSMRMPAAYVNSFRLYCSAFPVLSSSLIHSTVSACLTSLAGVAQDFRIRRIEQSRAIAPSAPQGSFSEVLDYSSVYRRYDTENNFLHMIESGNTENVLLAYQNMEPVGMQKTRYTGAIYQNPTIALSMVRALARKAAERGGASVVEIHEITQRSVQRMMSATSALEQNQVSADMILELTEAVRRHQVNLGNYSPPIRRVMEYLYLNYSQELSLEFLAELAGYSSSYFARQFKQELGTSVFSYLAHLRCAQAANMLRGTDYSIQEISNFVGYPDNNYFVKVFKKQFGKTPSEYRQEQRDT